MLANEEIGSVPDYPQAIDALHEAISEDRTLDEMLVSGDLDALVAALPPKSFVDGDARVRRLFEDHVDYGGNRPRMIQCTHEKIAVGITPGYAKVTGEPVGCAMHDTVGLPHGALGIYYAHVDRVPVMVFGGAGPMAYERRRPSIDWLHVSNVQGNLVRDYTKWDDQPASVASVHESVARGWRSASRRAPSTSRSTPPSRRTSWRPTSTRRPSRRTRSPRGSAPTPPRSPSWRSCC